MEQSLFVKYGSRVTSGMAECFYDRVLLDAELAPFFEGIDIETLREHLADFLTVVTGGPNIYKGRDIHEAHRHLAITSAHFDRLMTHIAAAAAELEIEPDDIATIAAAITDLKDQVVTA
ncbi:MAG: group I truncated hemoglobin [Candidatus Puniceispirillaceae bacterium]